MGFGCESTGDVTIFVGDSMTFIGNAIRSDFTCCIGVSWEGTDVVMIFLAGKAFSVTISWMGGDGILTSETLYGPFALREMTCCIGVSCDGTELMVIGFGSAAVRRMTC